MNWLSALGSGLRPASWRGIEFGVWTTESRFGRRTDVHEYPFRDPVWVEDLGRAPRRLLLEGFVVGDDLTLQVEELRDVAEQSGPGELVHPILGSMQLTLIEFSVGSRHDLGRVAILSFVFVEGEERQFPGDGQDRAGQIAEAADAADGAAEGDFGSRVLSTLRQGAQSVQQAQRTLRGWVGQARGVAREVRSVVGAVSGLHPGVDRVLNRYVTGRNAPLGQIMTATGTVTTVLRRVDGARAAVDRAGALVTRLGNLL